MPEKQLLHEVTEVTAKRYGNEIAIFAAATTHAFGWREPALVLTEFRDGTLRLDAVGVPPAT